MNHTLKFIILLVALATVLVSAADLKSDLREFVALIPRRRVGYIAARHFIVDQPFRMALDYIRSPAFPETWQEIRDTPDFREIVDYVTSYGSGYDITSVIDEIPNHLRSFHIPSKVPVDMMFQRNLTNFLREVIRSLPRARISSLMARKVKEGGEFAQLYEALRKDEFRQLVNKARNSTNLAAPLQKLIQQSIDVDDVIEIAFTMLSWGP